MKLLPSNLETAQVLLARNTGANGFSDFARDRLSFHLAAYGGNVESAVAMATVEHVANMITRTLQGARMRKQSAGGSPDAGGLCVPQGQRALDCAVARNGKGNGMKTVSLSETDKAEVFATVANVLATRGAYARPLERMDIGECFRAVESVNCLALNVRWQRDGDNETLAALSMPIYDSPEMEHDRQAKLTAKLSQALECLDAALETDSTRKRQAVFNAHKLTLFALIARKQSGNGKSKQRERAERADLAAYVKRGAQALVSKRLKSSPWQADLLAALESFQAQTD